MPLYKVVTLDGRELAYNIRLRKTAERWARDWVKYIQRMKAEGKVTFGGNLYEDYMGTHVEKQRGREQH